jgi:predicted GH43/DUF377 family glycosyl hydrolase
MKMLNKSSTATTPVFQFENSGMVMNEQKALNVNKNRVDESSRYIKRYEKNPIITVDDISTGAVCVFNTGFTHVGDETVGLINVWDHDWVPRFFVGRSKDGIHFNVGTKNMAEPPREYPYVPHEGIFDTRITPMDGVYYITYNVASRLGGRIMLARTTDFESLETMGFITGPDHRNCVLFPEKINGYYARLERPMGEGNIGDIYVSYSPDLMFWGKTKLLLEKNFRYWASAKIGAGAPPVKTQEGWLVLFHACRQSMNGFMYSMGCMLLDLNDPSLVRGRLNQCLLSPEMPYEQNGLVPNVIFPTAALRRDGSDDLWIYYGAADTCIGLARASVSELVNQCLANPML